MEKPEPKPESETLRTPRVAGPKLVIETMNGWLDAAAPTNGLFASIMIESSANVRQQSANSVAEPNRREERTMAANTNSRGKDVCTWSLVCYGPEFATLKLKTIATAEAGKAIKPPTRNGAEWLTLSQSRPAPKLDISAAKPEII